jgi:hypothetical protein
LIIYFVMGNQLISVVNTPKLMINFLFRLFRFSL